VQNFGQVLAAASRAFGVRQLIFSSTTNLYAQQLDEFSLVEADHRLAVNNCDRRALKTEIDQFFQGRLICANVFFDELNALLR
jgi:UDP-glucose 4-epimerase